MLFFFFGQREGGQEERIGWRLINTGHRCDRVDLRGMPQEGKERQHTREARRKGGDVEVKLTQMRLED